jgi:hypothetical protein
VLYKNQSKGDVVLKNQRKQQESTILTDKIDQYTSATHLLQEKMRNISNDTVSVILSALQNLSNPFKEHAKTPVPINKVKAGEFVGFLMGHIVYDLE